MVDKLRTPIRAKRFQIRERRVKAFLELTRRANKENGRNVALDNGRVKCGLRANETECVLSQDDRIDQKAQTIRQKLALRQRTREHRSEKHI